MPEYSAIRMVRNKVKAIFHFFFRGLSLFSQWTDDALKNVCFEAQIQEVRNKNSSSYTKEIKEIPAS